MKKNHSQFLKGFTLIEVLVSLSIFTIVMTISTGSVLSVIDANNKAQSLNSVMANLNIALESMSRSIRVGTEWGCPTVGDDCIYDNDPGSGSERFIFTSQDGDTVEFYREEDADGRGTIMRKVNTDDPVAMTAEEIDIQRLRFYSIGIDVDTLNQPKVIIIVGGEAGDREALKSSFDLQTTVSQRQLKQEQG